MFSGVQWVHYGREFQGETCYKVCTEASPENVWVYATTKESNIDSKEYNIVEIQGLYQLAESKSDHKWETWIQGVFLTL